MAVPVLRHPRYVIAVHDLARSARFYHEALGFDVHEIGDPGWRFFVRDECFIMAGECPDALSPRELGDHSYFAYVVVEGIEEFYRTVVAARATLIKPLRDEPWGMTEFGVETIDGHRIMFGSPIRTAA